MCDFIAGYLAGMAGVAVGHPLDTVKVNQQIHGTRVFQCTRDIYTQLGVRGYLRGLAFPLISIGACNSVFFGVYRVCVDQLDVVVGDGDKGGGGGVKQQRPYYFHSFVAGCAGGFAQTFVSCPVEVIKIKMQTLKQQQRTRSKVVVQPGSFGLTGHIVANHGVRGMYQGLVPMLYRDVPSYGLYMITYEFLSDWVRAYSGNSELRQATGVFVAGGIAGTLAWWSILPVDVVKSRMQAEDITSGKYTGIWHCTRCIYNQQGIRGFFFGFWSLTFRAFFVNGATFITLEWFNYICRRLQLQNGTIKSESL